MSKIDDLTGKKYNMLTVVERVESTQKGKARWKCLCDCGNTTIVTGSNLKSGAVKSCGCLIHKPHDTHHLSNTRLYRIWHHIKIRCNDPNHFAYSDYGGRGITICDEWNQSFENFYQWAISHGYKDGLSIDRKDNNGNYTPCNCKWSTAKEQANNRRSCVMIEYNGKTQSLMLWCEELGLNYKLIHDRMFDKKWSFEKAISTPVKSPKKIITKGDKYGLRIFEQSNSGS